MKEKKRKKKYSSKLGTIILLKMSSIRDAVPGGDFVSIDFLRAERNPVRRVIETGKKVQGTLVEPVISKWN